jgi:hypothetical protein
MSGGIIIQRRAALLKAAKDPSLYDNLPMSCKDKVDDIETKGPASCTEHDLHVLVKMIEIGLHC